jgi:radical SAM protein with 4Fe4S-binding SPASM domain
MSAPHAKHGSPGREEIMRVVDQMAECGIFQVGITGGEPLIREDFLEIVDALNEREIGINVIYTNGWLVDEKLLDELDKRNVHPGFQLSFDGVGCHDWLRGVPGSEERTIRALKLLQDRDYRTAVSMCVHRKNCHTIRESVNLMAGLGVKSMKCGIMMDLGEWMNPELADAKMTREEKIAVFEKYIPQYFEDDAPLSIMLGGAFMYTPGEPSWSIFYENRLTEEEAKTCPSCGILTKNCYIGADGMVAPCMGMADCGFAKNFPNLKDMSLIEILHDPEFTGLCNVKVGDIRDHNPKCRECRFTDRCTGGCRNAALMLGDDYFGIDTGMCEFFENGWDERIRKAAEPAFREYIKRNPLQKNAGMKEVKIDIEC